MQSLTVPTVRNPNDHTPTEIHNALRGATGSRRWSFRYELLSSANVKLADLSEVTAGSVEQNWLATIKRTARFTIVDRGRINYLQDRIKPWARLHLPPYGSSDWVEWPQGVFLLSTPERQVDDVGIVTREVQGYDSLQVYDEEAVTDRYTIDAGDVYTTEISTLLGSVAKNIAASSATLPATREWEPGTSKLRIINDLLDALNYESLSADEDGVLTARPYVAPSGRAHETTYADDQFSVIDQKMKQTIDLFGVPNQWVVVVSQPDRPVLTSTYTNNNPASPTSTVSRQRTITDFRTNSDAADQATLDALVERIAFEASQVYEVVDFTTAIMPIHSGNDVYRLTRSDLAINAKYGEHSWSLPLSAGSGARMRHTARRVVSV